MDTLAQIQEQMQLNEQLLRQARKTTAARVVKEYGERHELPPEDVTEILGALGLTAR